MPERPDPRSRQFRTVHPTPEDLAQASSTQHVAVDSRASTSHPVPVEVPYAPPPAAPRNASPFVLLTVGVTDVRAINHRPSVEALAERALAVYDRYKDEGIVSGPPPGGTVVVTSDPTDRNRERPMVYRMVCENNDVVPPEQQSLVLFDPDLPTNHPYVTALLRQPILSSGIETARQALAAYWFRHQISDDFVPSVASAARTTFWAYVPPRPSPAGNSTHLAAQRPAGHTRDPGNGPQRSGRTR